jgi:hypothetical protein
VTALPHITDAAARDAARRVLERPEYASWQTRDWLIDILKWLGRLHADDPALFWALTVALTLVLVAVVMHVVWTVRRGLREGAADDVRPTAPEPRFVEEADALAERGRFLDAARTIQLGAIHILVRGDVVRLHRGDANRALRRQIGQAKLGNDTREALLVSIADLERSWFRDRREDEGLYRRWRAAYRTLASEMAAA